MQTHTIVCVKQHCASNFVAKVWGMPFLFQHNNVPVHEAKPIKKRVLPEMLKNDIRLRSSDKAL